MKKVKDLTWGIEYDLDEQKQTISRILECYHSDGAVTFERFEYQYVPEYFGKPYEINQQ